MGSRLVQRAAKPIRPPQCVLVVYVEYSLELLFLSLAFPLSDGLASGLFFKSVLCLEYWAESWTSFLH